MLKPQAEISIIVKKKKLSLNLFIFNFKKLATDSLIDVCLLVWLLFFIFIFFSFFFFKLSELLIEFDGPKLKVVLLEGINFGIQLKFN